MLPTLLLVLAAPPAAPNPVAAGAALPADAQWGAVGACPRVATLTGMGRIGTGVTLAVRNEPGPDGSGGRFAYVLTAKHVVPGTEDRLVEFFTKESYPKPARSFRAVEVVREWADPDLALLKVKVGAADAFPTLRLAGPGERPKRFPAPALSVGCTEGAAPNCRSEVIVAKRPVRQANGVAFFWESQAPSVPGRSGGPLLDTSGRVIGLCVALQGERGYYTHLDEVLASLKRDGYEWLWSRE